MGDPRKVKKKYETPLHPWRAARIEREGILSKEFGLKNKKEIWKFETILRRFKSQAKKLIAREDKQAEKEEKLLKESVFSLGLIEKDSKLEDILGLGINHIMQRRLQTFILKLGLAKSAKQARQFIAHGHILVNRKKVTSPGYMIRRAEEGSILFSPSSKFNKADHPERLVVEKVQVGTHQSLAKKDLKPEEIAVLEKTPKREASPREETVKVEAE
ncbi:MAG: 30S ribosomal protein S4 [Nanoarchaeota archaeon]